MKDWPPSNYPLSIAFMLLVAIVVTLSIGDQKSVEDLAIYAYYFLVVGVIIRFFEIALPDGALQKFSSLIMGSADYINRHITKSINLDILKLDKMLKGCT